MRPEFDDAARPNAAHGAVGNVAYTGRWGRILHRCMAVRVMRSHARCKQAD